MNFSFQIIPFDEIVDSRSEIPLEESQIVTERKKLIQNFIISQTSKRHRRNEWKLNEQLKYVRCLIKNKIAFQSYTTEQKKNAKTNVLMSKAVQSRTPIQCHSHHQKMLLKYGSVDAVIEQFGPMIKRRTRTKQQPVQIMTALEKVEQPVEQLIESKQILLIKVDDFMYIDDRNQQNWVDLGSF